MAHRIACLVCVTEVMGSYSVKRIFNCDISIGYQAGFVGILYKSSISSA